MADDDEGLSQIAGCFQVKESKVNGGGERGGVS
jgi:hypothetical protein